MTTLTAKQLLDQDTTQLLALMAEAIINLNTNRAVWHEILNTAKSDLEELTRSAVFSHDHQFSMASPHWQQQMQVMLLRVEMLENLCGLLPLRSGDIESE